MGRRAGICVLVAAFATLLEVTAAAEEASGAAGVLDEEARALFDAGDYAGALDRLLRAQALLPATPRYYNLARCRELLGQLEDAIDGYEQFISRDDADAEMRGRAVERIEWLRRELARRADRPDTDDGPEGGAVPSPRQGRRRLRPPAFWALLATTAASGLTMAILGGVTLAREQAFGEGDVANCSDAQDDGRRLAAATDALLGVTAAAAAVTLVLGLLTDFSGAARLSIDAGPDHAALVLAGRL